MTLDRIDVHKTGGLEDCVIHDGNIGLLPNVTRLVVFYC